MNVNPESKTAQISFSTNKEAVNLVEFLKIQAEKKRLRKNQIRLKNSQKSKLL